MDLDLSEVLPSLTRQPMRMSSSNRPLGELQRQIETALGTRLLLTGGIGDLPVSGEFAGNDGLGFVKDLARKLRLDWAVSREGIFLAPESSSRTVQFTAPRSAVARRVAVLANQEFQDLGSNIRVVAQREEIQVTGIAPWLNQVAALRIPALVDFVQRTLAKQTQAGSARQPQSGDGSGMAVPANTEPLSLMVFRLNNAYVDDKQLNVGSSQVRIPGVATLFRQFTGLPVPRGDVQLTPGNAANSALARLARLDALAGGRGVSAGREQDVLAAPESVRPLDPVALTMTANQPAVIADSRMNALIVRDRASLQETYRNLVAVLDQPTDMIQLDAFVIDIKASRMEEFGLGLSWASSASSSGTQSADGLSQVTRQLLPGGSPVTGANVILQAARGTQLLANIRALESKGDSELLTVPSVVTLNNLEATFSSRQNFYVKVTGNQDASLTRVTAETLLKVTPLVAQTGGQNGNDRRIRLLISIQDGSIDASTSAVVDNLPRTMENQISTQAVVRGGDTLVIGGQVVRKRVNRNSGVPILQDIPLLGRLARSRTDEFEQYVRIYVVRPRLLGEDSSQLSGQVGTEGADPNSHRVLDRVPDLIRGSGLSPRRSDRLIDVPVPASTGPVRLDSNVPPVAPLVVPVPPAPWPAAAPGEESEGDGKTARPRKAAETPEDTQDWSPKDPKWRPPGNPLGTSLEGSGNSSPTPPSPPPSRSLAPQAETTNRQAAATPPVVPSQASRDRDARRIIETELQRANKAVARLEQEVSQGGSTAQQALERVKRDQASLQAELSRLTPSSSRP
jgi:type III secretion protein C